MKYNPFYITSRLGRKYLPDFIAEKFLARTKTSIERLYSGKTNSTWMYLNAIKKVGLEQIFSKSENFTILEAGTGLYNPISAPLILGEVSKLILLEPFRSQVIDFEKFNERFYGLLNLAEKDATFLVPKIKKPEDLKTESDFPKGVEVLDKLWEETGLPDNSVDLILSVSVFEHLRNPEAVITECSRILKPGGWMINGVDLRDHYFKYPFEMLKYPSKFWGFLTTSSKGSGFQNRWRISHWEKALTKHQFSTQVFPLEKMKDKMLKEKPFFDSEFKNLFDEDLEITFAVLVSEQLKKNMEKH